MAHGGEDFLNRPPLPLPEHVAAVTPTEADALLLALGRRGIVGSQLDKVGVNLPFTTAGAVVAETFVSMPFLVLTLAVPTLVAVSAGASP